MIFQNTDESQSVDKEYNGAEFKAKKLTQVLNDLRLGNETGIDDFSFSSAPLFQVSAPLIICIIT